MTKPIPYLKAAIVFLGKRVEAAGVEVAGVEAMVMPVSLVVVWNSSFSKSKVGVARCTSILAIHQSWNLFITPL